MSQISTEDTVLGHVVLNILSQSPVQDHVDSHLTDAAIAELPKRVARQLTRTALGLVAVHTMNNLDGNSPLLGSVHQLLLDVTNNQLPQRFPDVDCALKTQAALSIFTQNEHEYNWEGYLTYVRHNFPTELCQESPVHAQARSKLIGLQDALDDDEVAKFLENNKASDPEFFKSARELLHSCITACTGAALHSVYQTNIPTQYMSPTVGAGVLDAPTDLLYHHAKKTGRPAGGRKERDVVPSSLEDKRTTLPEDTGDRDKGTDGVPARSMGKGKRPLEVDASSSGDHDQTAKRKAKVRK